MSNIDLKQNFAAILSALEERGMKRTSIAKEIGYTTTAQLNSTLSGDSLLSTKAIIGLIENLNVNPTFMFLGQGEMFLTDESEFETLRKEYSELQRKFFANQDDLIKCKAELERAIYRYNKLIDITSIALDKTQKSDEVKDNSDKE
jgi:hypothetical protein